MVIDAISFAWELDLLELRLSELDAVVDRFVIVEATRTHKGDLKPLHYAENKARFAQWEEKIAHVAVGDLPQGDGLPAIRRREMTQRNAILRGIRDCADDDIILISDCDEIPRSHLIPHELEDGIVATYLQKLYYFNFNTHAPDRVWPGTRVCRVADARAMTPHIVRNGMGQGDVHYPRYMHIADGGGHYSYFGGTEAIRRKQTQFLHQELVTPHDTDPATIEARVKAGVDIWGRPHEQEFVIGPADDLPLVVLRDLEKYLPHFAEGWPPEFHENWYSGGQALYMAHLARQAPEQGAIVEIGAWEGRSTIVLAQMVAPRVVHVVDHWRGNLDEDADHESAKIAAGRDVKQVFHENVRRVTAGNIQSYHMSWQAWLDAFKYAGMGYRLDIAFLHLDASHDRASVRDCLQAVKPYLVDGAILCGDDAYDERVIAGARDVFPDAEVIGERLWKVTYARDS